MARVAVAPPGLEYLLRANGLLMKQTRESTFQSYTTYDLFGTDGQLAYQATEQRECCGPRMELRVNNTQGYNVLNLFLPSDFCNWDTKLQVFCSSGELLGYIYKEWTSFSIKFDILDPSGLVCLKVKGPGWGEGFMSDQDYKVMSVEYRNFQSPLEDTKPTNSPPGTWPLQGILMDRQTAQPSSTLICFLSSLCTALLFITIILFVIFTRQGVNQMEQNMEVKLRNLSLGVQSRVEGLSKLGSQMMERMKVMQHFLKDIQESKVMNTVEEIESLVIRIVSDEVAGSLSNDNQRILVALGQLADQIFKPNSSSADPLCDRGWEHHGSSCYLLIRRIQTWSFAKKDCEDRKGHLVVINDEQEMGFLRTFSQSIWWVWIGLKEEDSAWKWVDGTSYDETSKFWLNGEVDYWESRWMFDKYGTWEECGLLGGGNELRKFHCSNEFAYFCEKKMS